jgi:hypothetical protein
MVTFNDLKFEPHQAGIGGVQATHEFPNGYGASVIKASFSYGGREGFYELAVLKGGSLCYETPITEDVIGHLTEDAVTSLLTQIEALPAVVNS